MRKQGVFLVTLVLALCLSACGKKTAKGTLHICLADEIERTAYQSIDEKIIDEEGETVAILTDGLLLNLVLEHGEMDMDGSSFTADETIYTCPELTDRHLLVVRTFFGDVNPTLRVSFEGAEGRAEYFLIQSGEASTVLLIPADELLSDGK